MSMPPSPQAWSAPGFTLHPRRGRPPRPPPWHLRRDAHAAAHTTQATANQHPWCRELGPRAHAIIGRSRFFVARKAGVTLCRNAGKAPVIALPPSPFSTRHTLPCLPLLPSSIDCSPLEQPLTKTARRVVHTSHGMLDGTKETAPKAKERATLQLPLSMTLATQSAEARGSANACTCASCRPRPNNRGPLLPLAFCRFGLPMGWEGNGRMAPAGMKRGSHDTHYFPGTSCVVTASWCVHGVVLMAY